MKRLKIYLAYVAVAAMFMTSCSKEESPDSPPDGEKTAALSFNVLLKDYQESNKSATKQQVVPPSCDPDEGTTVPSIVRAVIAVGSGDTGTYVDDGDNTNGNAVDISIIPEGSNDPDGDGMSNWLTFEEDFLELTEGEYTLLYFEVLNAAGETLYMAPNSTDDYGPYSFDNFVEDPLPHVIAVNEGEKPYDEVEVLCYDEVFAEQFGYLFFDFEMLPLQYICLFGNECNDAGRHFPSNFRIKVWDYPSNGEIGELSFDDEDALVNATNEVVREGGIVVQADALCIPLPDRPNVEDTFYAEVYTIDAAGNEVLIRRGDFSETEIDDLIAVGDDPAIEGTQKYWHFREGEYCGADSDPCLLSRVTEDWAQDFETGELLAGTDTDYIDVDTDGDGDFDEFDTPGAPSPYGGYLITNNPSDYYGPFVGVNQPGDDGMFIVFDGSPDSSERVYFTRTTPTLCAGDNYYVTMRVKDISVPDDNNTRLRVTYRTGDPDSAEIAGEFTIVDLSTENADSDWALVGFVLTADEDGQMTIRIRDTEDENSGNDFAMDDIVFSNDPMILNGVIHINPNN